MYRLKSHHLVVLNQSPVRAIRPSWLLLGFAFLMMIIITACSSASTEVPPTPTEVPPTPGPISDEALMAAVKSDDVAEVKRLLEGGADPNYKQDSTLLMLVAVNRGNLDILKLLVGHGGLVYADNLPNPLRIIGDPVTESETEFFSYLLEQMIAQGWDLEQAADNIGSTALFHAAWNDQHGLMQLLVDAGADIDRPNDNGVSPLNWAAFQGRLETVRLIVELGADLNYQDFDGETALHVATRGDQVEVVKYLVEAGARLDLENDSGDTALDYASDSNNEEIRMILQEGSN